jgi:HD-GYP domain-containing protein (c-di-GMP phosphodiesterase class II)
MVRISDIFKKSRTEIHPPVPKTAAEVSPPETSPSEAESKISPASPYKRISPEDLVETKNTAYPQIAEAMQELRLNKAKSQNLYLTGIQLVKELLKNAEELKPISLEQIKSWVQEVVEQLILKNIELLRPFYEYAADNYLYSHMVNVAVMSTELGLGFGYNKSRLNELALAAFFHDIGMIKVEKLAFAPRKLSEEEYSQIKNHPAYGAEILSHLKDIPESVIYVVKEEHERLNGKGYPNGIKDGDINEYARIIAIVDVFEALTHDRPYRKKYSPHDAIKEMLSTNNASFDPKILKVFINKIGMYPVNSWIELNTNEIARVIMGNEEFPLRPVVQVFFDRGKNSLKEPRTINLAEQFNIFIKKPLSEDEVYKTKGEAAGT